MTINISNRRIIYTPALANGAAITFHGSPQRRQRRLHLPGTRIHINAVELYSCSVPAKTTRVCAK